MAMQCATCRHPNRPAIDEALVSGASPLQELARSYGVSAAALFRHKSHIPSALASAKQAREVGQATVLLDRIEVLINAGHTIASAAQAEKQWTSAIGALREVRCCLELLGKVSGEIQQGATVNLQQNQVLPSPVFNVVFVKPNHDELTGANCK